MAKFVVLISFNEVKWQKIISQIFAALVFSSKLLSTLVEIPQSLAETLSSNQIKSFKFSAAHFSPPLADEHWAKYHHLSSVLITICMLIYGNNRRAHPLPTLNLKRKKTRSSKADAGHCLHMISAPCIKNSLHSIERPGPFWVEWHSVSTQV